LPKKKKNDLARYQDKRDFGRTPEPRGTPARARGRRLTYVIQKHDARRLHYDLRLEHDGVLKSWAVPKEPAADSERRLAVETEDHPLEYATFEGEIPEHQYGAGSVVLWDRGHWTPVGDADRGLAEGKLDFELHGERLRGRWTLVRMKGRSERKDQKSWLLIKRTDRERRPAKKSRAEARGDRAGALERTPEAKRRALPTRPIPQLATLVREPPSGEEWIHEPKLDGYRLLCRVERGEVTLLTRRGNDWTDRFPDIAEAAASLPCRAALLDGEAVVFDDSGGTRFQRLQATIGRRNADILLVTFDLLHLDGWDVSGAPLVARKGILSELLAGAPRALLYSDHVVGEGERFFREACRLGLEGMVSKRAADPYRGGRTRSWLKVKCVQRQELVIVGYTEPSGSRAGLGALLLGAHERPGEPLRYVGRVGTGFTSESLTELESRLSPLERRTPPVSNPPRGAAARGVHWVEPRVVAEVAFTEWTEGGVLRHPSFRGIREDKAPGDVAVERAEEVAATGRVAPSKGASAGVRLTNPDRVLFPEQGITKRQLADYWERVASVALPQLAQRPLTLVRCPEGHERQCFYQKHVGVAMPAVVPRVRVSEDEEPYAMVDAVPALIGLVQMGVLELHVWGSRADRLEQPDILVWDLDPSEELPWSEVVRAGLDLRERLAGLGLTAFARLTGGKGLHVVVPVVPGPEWSAVKRFAHAVVTEMVREEPRRFTASMSKNRRGGKIFIDHFRNARGATAIASYSPRARSGAPVALPIEWDELAPDADEPPRYGLLAVPGLIARRRRDPWGDMDAVRATLTK
jgi:bifunctional non-homologous end joining protein LigD